MWKHKHDRYQTHNILRFFHRRYCRPVRYGVDKESHDGRHARWRRRAPDERAADCGAWRRRFWHGWLEILFAGYVGEIKMSRYLKFQFYQCSAQKSKPNETIPWVPSWQTRILRGMQSVTVLMKHLVPKTTRKKDIIYWEMFSTKTR